MNSASTAVRDKPSNPLHNTLAPPPPCAAAAAAHAGAPRVLQVRVRLGQFHEHVQAVSDFYGDVMTVVDGDQAKDKVYAAITGALDAAKARKTAAGKATTCAPAAAGELDAEILGDLAKLEKEAEARLADKKKELQKALEN